MPIPTNKTRINTVFAVINNENRGKFHEVNFPGMRKKIYFFFFFFLGLFSASSTSFIKAFKSNFSGCAESTMSS